MSDHFSEIFWLSYLKNTKDTEDTEFSGIVPLFLDEWNYDQKVKTYIENSIHYDIFWILNNYQMSHDYPLTKNNYKILEKQLYNYFAKRYYDQYLISNI
jgi:hypothetical protein